MLLKDKVIFLTGGSTGIGWDCAKAYAAEGAKVVLVARGWEAVTKAAAELGGAHLGFPCDVSQDAEVKAAIEKTLVHFGRLDAVHNNAGIGTPAKAIHETTDGERAKSRHISDQCLLLRQELSDEHCAPI